ncbi:MAG: diguanylate cyclase and metal dependent phosphohydrolase [Promethearchaeota archaeon CR_4]|nr:MAG: diguanylate cyclase and metal dependent phosphohydrolase [Candidatus Lokiarchaeota archaeon CR_4]
MALQITLRTQRPRGQVIRVLNNVSVYRNQMAVGVLTAARNATEFKRVENTLTGEKSYSITLHSIGDGVITGNTRGNVSTMNVVAEQLLERIQEDGQGKPLAEIFYFLNVLTRERCENPAVYGQFVNAIQQLGLNWFLSKKSHQKGI